MPTLIELLLNPGVARTFCHGQMRYYLVYNLLLLLLHMAFLLSSILVNLSRPEPGRRRRPGFHPQVMDDMSLRWERLAHAKSRAQRFPSPAKAKFWLMDNGRAKAPQSNPGPFTAQDLRKDEMRIHLTPSVTRLIFWGKRYCTEGNFIGASLLYRSKQPLDHTIMGKEDKHTPPCCKARLPSRPQGYRAPAELLNATKLIYISAQQLRFTNAHTQP